MLQQVNEVHSVRWRIKQPEHLMAKIIRKRNNGAEKYNKISVDNYQKIVTDLIGIRVLHLFKKRLAVHSSFYQHHVEAGRATRYLSEDW